MPGVARRNRVFGGTLKLRDYERARARESSSARNHGIATTVAVVVIVVVDGGGGGFPAGSCNVN